MLRDSRILVGFPADRLRRLSRAASRDAISPSIERGKNIWFRVIGSVFFSADLEEICEAYN